MIKNKEHYQITGTIEADFGQTVTNPIIKIDVNPAGATTTGLLNCEYNVYISATTYTDGKYFFKAEKDGARLVNFTYPVANVPTFGFGDYKEEQRKIIADTFGFDIANVVLVEEPTE